MEELDLLKKDWKRKENTFSQVSEPEIYNMIHRKSSSIVKWILIISILEVCLWIGIGFLYSSDEYLKPFKHDGLMVFLNAINWMNYGVTLVFIYLFYKNYANISAIASTRKLMKDILNTRKTVKYYVWYNLGMITIWLVSSLVLALRYSEEGNALLEKMQHEDKIMVLIICILFLFVVVAIVICWVIYRLLYGILLRKLLANYKILKQINLE